MKLTHFRRFLFLAPVIPDVLFQYHGLVNNKRLYPWIGLTAIACLALVAAHLLDVRAAAIPAKLIASTAFLMTALVAGAFRSRYGKVLFLGLVLSWCGDAFLLGTTDKMFLFGLGAFLLAHVAYVIAFTILGLRLRWVLAAIIPVALVSLGFMVWLTPWVSAEIRIPVYVYSIVISLMVISAFGARGKVAPMLIPMGALLFYFSDLSVAIGQFTQTSFPHYVWGLPLYYTAQIMLAISAGNQPMRMKK